MLFSLKNIIFDIFDIFIFILMKKFKCIRQFVYSKKLLNLIKILIMKDTYRLEFNERQQNFHLDNYTHEPNTYGWFTIKKKCTDFEFQIFESFVTRIKKKELTKAYLLKCKDELDLFIKNLKEYNIEFIKIRTPE
jgi:hypothetical protein